MVFAINMKSATRYYQVGAVALAIRCEVPAVLEDCDRLYGGFRTQQTLPDAIQFHIRRLRTKPWKPLQHVLCYDDCETVAGPEARAVIPELEAAINQQVLQTHAEYFQLHAGVMARDNGAVVFTGKSGTGKTTLAAALLARDWKYVCDEFALINPDSLLVYPFPKPLSIKQSGLDLIRELELPICDRDWVSPKVDRRFTFVVPWEIRADCLAAPCAINVILFATRREHMPPRLTRLSDSEAAMTLYRLGLNTHNLKRAGFDAAVSLARRTRCFEVNLGSLEHDCDMIESLMSESRMAAQSVA